MIDRLIIKDGNLHQGLASLVAAQADFDGVTDRANEAADACGHAALGGALRTSSSNWQLRRGKLSAALTALNTQLKQTIQVFEETDSKIGQQLGDGQQPTGGGDSQQQSPSPSETPQARPVSPAPPPGVGEGSHSTGSGAQGGSGSGFGGGGFSGGGASGSWDTAHDGAPAHSGTSEPSGGASGAPAPVVPPDPGTGSSDSVSGIATGALPNDPVSLSTGTRDAQLARLVSDFVARWISLGGSQTVVMAALVAAGLAGIVSGVGSGKSGAGGRAFAPGDAASGADPDAPAQPGSEGPTAVVPEAPPPLVAPAGNGAGGEHADPVPSAAPLGGASEPGAGADLAASAPPSAAQADLAQSAPSADPGPASGSPLPPLREDAGAAPASESGSVAEPLPPLTAAQPTAAGHEAAGFPEAHALASATPAAASLPSLTDTGSQHAAPSPMLAGALPMGAAMMGLGHAGSGSHHSRHEHESLPPLDASTTAAEAHRVLDDEQHEHAHEKGSR